MTVWIYVDTSKEVGDVDHLKVFASKEAAEVWLNENDPEGVANPSAQLYGGFVTMLSADH
jgi:hypothetical protein